MSLQEQVEFPEELLSATSICDTGTTCQGLADCEVTEESPIEDAEEWAKQEIWKARHKMRVSHERDIDSPLTLDFHFVVTLSYTSESPFDALEEMLDDEEKITKLINYVRDKSTIHSAWELAARLNFLYEAVKEDPDEFPVLPESLSNFIGFLQNTPNLRCPDVVLTPSNEIRAQWRTAPNRHFAAIFLPTGETRFVIFTPNPRDPDRIDRLSGTTSVDSLIETAQPHRVLDWASR